MNFTVDGQPVPQPRARISTRGGFARGYVPKDHKIHLYRHAVATAAKAVCPHPTDDQVIVKLCFTLARPPSHMNKSGCKKNAPLFPKCDCDNLAKGCLDAMTGIVWYDDSQVVELHIAKHYGTAGSTEVSVEFPS